MWLSVDRIEGETVVLIDDANVIRQLSVADYTALAGRAPQESDVLEGIIDGDRITAAYVDETETACRRDAARARLNRLFGRRA